MQERVNNGEVLSDLDLRFLKEVHADTARIKPLLDDKPEYHPLVTQLVGLYKDIADKALENEKNLK